MPNPPVKAARAKARPSTKPRCPAKAKSTQRPCEQPAGFGTKHPGAGLCRFHGGNSPGGEKQGMRLLAQAAAQAFGLPLETSADEALESELWRTAGTVAWLGRHLQTVEPSERLSGDMAAYAQLYSDERRHLLAVGKACVEVGLDERRVAMLERAAEGFSTVLRHILDELGVLDHPDAPMVVQRNLAQLGPGMT